MTRLLLADFADQERLVGAARHARNARYRVVDSHTPYPIEEIFDVIERRPSRVRLAMFAGGLLMAALAYGLEYYSAAVDYPYNSGGRPLDSWPAFMLVPFATAILVAAVCGFTAFLFETQLPNLSNPLFAAEGFDRASQDRFLLVIESPSESNERTQALELLQKSGAISAREVEG